MKKPPRKGTKLYSLHVLLPESVLQFHQARAKTEGLPLSLYVRRILTDLSRQGDTHHAAS